MSAVLFQVKMDGTRSIISYGSAKYSPAELRYEQAERDCLAVIWGLKKYKAYLLSRHFILLTDTTSLNWLSQFKVNSKIWDIVPDLRQPYPQP